MPSRRQVLAACAASVAAGCAGVSDESRSESHTTESETPRPIFDCSTPTDPPNPTIGDDAVSARSYPSLPAELDADAASSFASAYESAYATHRFLEEHSGVQSFSLRGPAVSAVEPTARRYLVRLSYSYGFGANPDDAATTEVAGDSPRIHVVYLVGDGVVARTDVSRATTLEDVSMEDMTAFVCES